MTSRSTTRTTGAWLAAGIGLAAGAYTAWVGLTWARYGTAVYHDDGEDPLLDTFMPVYEVVERHQIHVAAPAAITLAAAREIDLLHSPVVRAIVEARELILGATGDDRVRPRGLVAELQSLGWGILAEVPEREIVVGAVTQPWEANVTFRALPPAEFTTFSEPGYVKIAWTLRADPAADDTSVFRTETRALATSPDARARFRTYWSFVSPGIALIRVVATRLVKREAEQRAEGRRTAPQAAGEVA